MEGGLMARKRYTEKQTIGFRLLIVSGKPGLMRAKHEVQTESTAAFGEFTKVDEKETCAAGAPATRLYGGPWFCTRTTG